MLNWAHVENLKETFYFRKSWRGEVNKRVWGWGAGGIKASTVLSPQHLLTVFFFLIVVSLSTDSLSPLVLH